MVAGCTLTSKLICIGHRFYSKISLWSWTGQSYELIRKTSLYGGGGAYMDFSITMIRKDAFSSLPNQIFMVAGGDSLTRMTINAKDIKSSDKLKLKSPRFKDQILDYKQLSSDHIVRL